KWTQWIFLQLFESYYNRATGKAESIASLVTIFEEKGNEGVVCPGEPGLQFSAADWKAFSFQRQQEILMNYRLAYCGYGEVNWCEALGTVLANDEVVNGVSERGGHPVVKKKLRQWYLRITEYADRLLEGLDRIEFSEAMKEMQTNWIGKSYGAEIDFAVKSEKGSVSSLRVYTTRPDTIFGVDFMVVAPELDIVEGLKSEGQAAAVEQYLDYVKSRSERERMAEKKITGVFTGSYAINPFDGREIPIWLSEYVLAGYGTGAIMAVPCGDERDHRFAEHFSIPITNIIGAHYDGKEANPTKDAILENSGFLNGIGMREATEIVLKKLEEMGIGNRKVNYRMRDAAFSRQRYWGEPFPVKWQNGVAKALPASDLPLELPYVESYKPGPEGEGPLANIPEWIAAELETNTMPGYAGSSWYFLRYMDPKNDKEFCSRAASDYWGQVDLYIGGTEHAVGHLLYSRMWTKVLYDLGHIGFDEPYKKLVNQGMIQGSSRFVYRVNGINTFVSKGLLDEEGMYEGKLVDKLHVDVNIVDGYALDTEAFKKWKPLFANAEFVLEDGQYICGSEVEKMSKGKFNTVNPDIIVEKFGADTFRMYEMFLGPVEISKPWDTKGIEGVHRFLKKFWRLYVDENKGLNLTDEAPTAAELKVLHRTIRKIEEDTERFSFNTGVSGFMICVNELNELKCRKKSILLPLLVLLAPYAPHITEELWQLAGQAGSVLDAAFPEFKEEYVRESAKAYPVAINGKTRTEITIGLEASQAAVEEIVLGNELVQKWLEGKAPKKIVYVKNRMINVVI
ncbi:MAG: leucine--tRNA ligase, partial [Flavihumibacter sp.]|nr:leucine--tRNA ligase [Flavihumibacter sp.]